jgi:hypothetical protein
MTLTANISGQIERPLDELKDALNRCSPWSRSAQTTDVCFEQLEDAMGAGLDLADLAQGNVWTYKAHTETRQNIVRSLMGERTDTVIGKEQPVGWQVEDIAKDFCQKHGLVPDLVNFLNQAEICFSNVREVVAEYDCFHADDYEEDGHIVIRIKVCSDQDTAFREYDAMNAWTSENMSDDSIEYFVLTVSRIE